MKMSLDESQFACRETIRDCLCLHLLPQSQKDAFVNTKTEMLMFSSAQITALHLEHS